MSVFSKSSGSGTTTTTPSPAQAADIAAASNFDVNTLYPALGQLIGGVNSIYNQSAPGVTNAGQNLATVGGQVQQTAGGVGESALRSGVSGLESLFTPQYEQNQISAAMAPAEAQYQQNLAGLNAGFGGAGQIGSARQALAQNQLAGQTQALQAQTAAGIENQIEAQKAQAAQSLISGGYTGLNQAIQGAQQGVAASQLPLATIGSLANMLYGVPSSLTAMPNIGQTTTTTGSNTGINLSDVTAKENIEFVGLDRGHRIYDFNYRGRPERYRGVMAQEVARYCPTAVVRNADGYLMVDYNKLGIEMTQLGVI